MMLLRLVVLSCLLAGPAFAEKTDGDTVSADSVPSLKPAEVPRDERRQQILLGIYEKRFSYTLAHVPMQTTLFAECYLDGRMTHRFKLVSAMHWNNGDYRKGFLSVGWNHLTHALTLINDNGFGFWNGRVQIAPEMMRDLMAVVGTEHPEPELRDTVNDYPAKKVTIYPVIGLVGPTSARVAGQTRFGLTTARGLLAQAADYHSSQCVIIYLFSDDNGGDPPFKFDGEKGFYVNSLPMN